MITIPSSLPPRERADSEGPLRAGDRNENPDGIGLLSFTVGNQPEQLEERIVNYRKGLAEKLENIHQLAA